MGLTILIISFREQYQIFVVVVNGKVQREHMPDVGPVRSTWAVFISESKVRLEFRISSRTTSQTIHCLSKERPHSSIR